MKWFFIFLLLANFAYLGWEIDRGVKQQRVNQQSAIAVPANAKQLQLVTELDTPPAARQAKAFEQEDVNDFATTPVLPIELNPNTENMIEALLNESVDMQVANAPDGFELDDTTDLSSTSGPTVCYTYGPIPDAAESQLMSEWLGERGIEYDQRQTAEDGKPKFWVYLAPQASTAKAEATVMELRQQGIRDLQLIRSGDLLNAVSLGLFTTQAAVNRRLNEIQATGYQPVVVPYASANQVYWFDVRIVQNSAYVDELFTGFPARFNALPVDCNEIAMQ